MGKGTNKNEAGQEKWIKQGFGKEESAVERGKVLMSWQVRPYLLDKRKTAILVASTLLFSGIVWYSFDLAAGILSFVISLGSFSSFLSTSSYELSERGIQVKTGINYPVFHKWTAFKDYRVFADGIHLNYNKWGVRERLLKSQFIYFGEADGELAKRIITEHMEAAQS